MNRFAKALLKHVAPGLEKHGYRHTEAFDASDGLYGFHKCLGGDIQLVVLFIRWQDTSERPVGYGFEVKLFRRKIQDTQALFRKLSLGLYDGAMSAGLDDVLWQWYGLRTYGSYRYVWEPETASDAETAFADATDKLGWYGIPWLENPYARNGNTLNQLDWNEFQDAVREIAEPGLRESTYEMLLDNNPTFRPGRERQPYYFTKSLRPNLYAFIAFYPRYHIEWSDPEVMPALGSHERRPRCFFDVFLRRRNSPDPHNLGITADAARFEASLGMHLLKREPQDSTSRPPFWGYSTREELDAQLADAVLNVKQIGIPILEGTQNVAD